MLELARLFSLSGEMMGMSRNAKFLEKQYSVTKLNSLEDEGSATKQIIMDRFCINATFINNAFSSIIIVEHTGLLQNKFMFSIF